MCSWSFQALASGLMSPTCRSDKLYSFHFSFEILWRWATTFMFLWCYSFHFGVCWIYSWRLCNVELPKLNVSFVSLLVFIYLECFKWLKLIISRTFSIAMHTKILFINFCQLIIKRQTATSRCESSRTFQGPTLSPSLGCYRWLGALLSGIYTSVRPELGMECEPIRLVGGVCSSMAADCFSIGIIGCHFRLNVKPAFLLKFLGCILSLASFTIRSM